MGLLVVTRYVVEDADGGDAFRLRARDALDALCTRPGCRRGHLGRSMDDPRMWVMATEWDSVGSYRRALSSYEVKVRAVPVMYDAVDEPSAYEVLVEGGPDGLVDGESDLSVTAATAAPGQRPDR